MEAEPMNEWDRERQRLQLAAAGAIKALMAHMGPVEAMYLPYDGELMEVRKVKQEVSGRSNA